jgi:integrase
MRVITFEEQAAYLAKASQPLRDIAEIILDTGMRREEVFRIRVENVDFKQNTIFNPFGKTKAARRMIPMTDNVVAILKRRARKARPMESSFVFASLHDAQKPIGSVKGPPRRRHAGRNQGTCSAVRSWAHICYANGGIWRGFANAQRITGTCEYSDDHAICSFGSGTETHRNREVRKVSRTRCPGGCGG